MVFREVGNPGIESAQHLLGEPHPFLPGRSRIPREKTGNGFANQIGNGSPPRSGRLFECGRLFARELNLHSNHAIMILNVMA